MGAIGKGPLRIQLRVGCKEKGPHISSKTGGKGTTGNGPGWKGT